MDRQARPIATKQMVSPTRTMSRNGSRFFTTWTSQKQSAGHGSRFQTAYLACANSWCRGRRNAWPRDAYTYSAEILAWLRLKHSPTCKLGPTLCHGQGERAVSHALTLGYVRCEDDLAMIVGGAFLLLTFLSVSVIAVLFSPTTPAARSAERFALVENHWSRHNGQKESPENSFRWSERYYLTSKNSTDPVFTSYVPYSSRTCPLSTAVFRT